MKEGDENRPDERKKKIRNAKKRKAKRTGE